MDFNKNKDKKQVRNCVGTCKTPIGCTCKVNKTQNIVTDNSNNIDSKGFDDQIDIVDVEAERSKKTCQTQSCCKTKTGSCGKKNNSCCSGRNKLEVYDWLRDIPQTVLDTQMVEVQFKNTRKGYYLNSNNLELNRCDMVAVEATPGHDIGEVTLTGKLVQLQMKKNNFRGEVKRVYRIAKPNDLDKWTEARAKEHKTMLRAREIAENLRLDMKISDVEYQGDGNKAIFYYIADGRVDFRQLIKDYASEFRIKIEMKQIGARQEAGRVGGIGPCGRELCCSSSMSNFVSVSTSAARLQDIPLNPQKLAGQCGKLKCCLNFEVDTYVEAQKKLPSRNTILETKDNMFYLFKTDVLSGNMTYSTDKHFAANLVTIDKDRAFEVIRMNRNSKRPLHLATDNDDEQKKNTSHDLLENENIDRFDSENRNNNKRRKKKRTTVETNELSQDKQELHSNEKVLNKKTDSRQNGSIERNNNKGQKQNQVSQNLNETHTNKIRQRSSRNNNRRRGNRSQSNDNGSSDKSKEE